MEELPQHGTRARYQLKCPCEECRAANSQYMKERRDGMTHKAKVRRYDALARVWRSYLESGSEFALANHYRDIMEGGEDA